MNVREQGHARKPFIEFYAHSKRKIYDVLVERTRMIPNDMDGSTAARAIPAPHDKSWLEVQGITEVDTSELYMALMDDWFFHPGNGLYLGDNAWAKFMSDCTALRMPSIEGDRVRRNIAARHNLKLVNAVTNERE